MKVEIMIMVEKYRKDIEVWINFLKDLGFDFPEKDWSERLLNKGSGYFDEYSLCLGGDEEFLKILKENS